MRLVIWGLLATAVVTLSACNTMRGVGRDVQATGAAVEGTATEVQEEVRGY